MKIFNKNNEILSSGTIVTSKNDYIEFHIPNSKLIFRFKFLDSDEETTFSRTEIVKDENSNEIMEVHFFNFHKFNYTGNKEPMRLASFNKKGLSIKFRVEFVGKEKADLIFHYTWLISREEVKNEQ